MIATSVVISDTKLLSRIMTTARGYTARVRVGYFGNERHAGKRPITLGNLAGIHEHGTRHTPKRMFVYPALKKNRGKYLKLAGGSFLPIVRGRKTTTQTWHYVGQQAVEDVQDFMVTATFTPLNEKTIKQKGSSRPLVDTGQLRQSVTYRVKK
ncbi:hypothetical protein [Moraxella lacunata]|uniref:Uncharacterized protein n=1 Tax=Moraxella lacunata TaxID=477 RepID=A0A1V4GW23_MORLA|nr:hypothetical protein [Moraxella lacunata]OPH36630.1 hypothetical protein B5J94_07030 [Moraxella lacunata]